MKTFAAGAGEAGTEYAEEALAKGNVNYAAGEIDPRARVDGGG